MLSVTTSDASHLSYVCSVCSKAQTHGPILIKFLTCAYFGPLSGHFFILIILSRIAVIQKTLNYIFLKIVSKDFDQILYPLRTQIKVFLITSVSTFVGGTNQYILYFKLQFCMLTLGNRIHGLGYTAFHIFFSYEQFLNPTENTAF